MLVYIVIIAIFAVVVTFFTFFMFLVFIPAYFIAALLSYYIYERLLLLKFTKIRVWLCSSFVGAVVFTLLSLIEGWLGIFPPEVFSSNKWLGISAFFFISSSIVFLLINLVNMLYRSKQW